MAQAHYTAAADQQLVQIGRRIARDNPAAAIRWVKSVERICELLAVQPGIGQRVNTKRLGEARRHIIDSYLNYYRPCADGVEILAVVHGARDRDKLV